MPIDWLVIISAFTAGLLGGVHCLAMCGGIATSLGASSRVHALRDAWLANIGRISGYTLAGLLAGGVGNAVMRVVQLPWLAQGMRMLVGAVLILLALRLLFPHTRMALLSKPAQGLWRWLQPLQRKVMPINTPLKRFAAGALWGWLPCGLSTTMLGAAWLQGAALQGGLTMLAFGLGTLPLMIPLTWSGAAGARVLSRPAVRHWAGMLLLLAGVLTLLAPWLMQVPAMHGLLSALGCRSLSAAQ